MNYSLLAKRLSAAAAAALFCTCGTLNKFDVGTSASAQIPKASILDELLQAVDFSGFDDLDFSKEIANQGVKKDEVDSVRLKSFVIHTKEGSGLTMDFIDSVEFYAESDGLPKILVAHSESFKGKTSVELTVDTTAELQPYVVAPAMTLEAKVSGKRPPQDTELTADVELTVEAAIPGCH
jgi:hypothetical protein